MKNCGRFVGVILVEQKIIIFFVIFFCVLYWAQRNKLAENEVTRGKSCTEYMCVCVFI